MDRRASGESAASSGGGAEAWQITVQWEPEYERTTRARFPTASTCARTLSIPEYESEDLLRDRLREAVEQTAFTDQ